MPVHCDVQIATPRQWTQCFAELRVYEVSSAVLRCHRVLIEQSVGGIGIHAKVHALLTRPDATAGAELGKLAALSGVREFPARVKCASLCWHTLNAALAQGRATVSTELPDEVPSELARMAGEP